MGIRLYDSAWVVLDGIDGPVQVRRDRRDAGAFNVGDFQYDIDGRPLKTSAAAPRIAMVHNLQTAREAGLSTSYSLGNQFRL